MLLWLTALLAAMGFTGGAGAEEAPNLTDRCTIEVSAADRGSAKSLSDGSYETYWQSKKGKTAEVTIESPSPLYGLYLCFERMPEEYTVLAADGQGSWREAARGDLRFHHVFYPLNGETRVRVVADAGGKKSTYMGFNEIFVFGAGEIPDWVQRWEPTAEKADLLFLAMHPDDDLLFMGGAIATYAAELKKQVVVAYMSYSNTTRRSEALNGLWTLGVRQYPVFLGIRDVWSNSLKEAYSKVDGGKNGLYRLVTALFRQVKPEVVVTHDLNGEYGHMQHRMTAQTAIDCVAWAADPEKDPESAAAFGPWQVQKLYLHLYGDESSQTRFNFDVPLAAMGGKTGMELAAEAYAKHVTQQDKGQSIHGVWHPFSVEEYGRKLFPATVFGLYASQVGPDALHTDFLENLPAAAAMPEAGTATAGAAGSAAATEEEDWEDLEEDSPEDPAGESGGELLVEEVVLEETAPEGNTAGNRATKESGAAAAPEAGTGESGAAAAPETGTGETGGAAAMGNAVETPADQAAGPAPDWAPVTLNAKGFLDEGEFVYEDAEEGHYFYASPSIRVQIEETVVTPDKKHPFHCFTAHVWCDVAAGELPHTVSSNPESPRSDPRTIAQIGEEQRVVLATSTDYYTYRAGRKKNTKSVHVGIEIRNGEILWDDAQIKNVKMPNYETLALFRDGTGASLPSKDKSAGEYLAEGATEVFTFGPCLVRDGELTEYLKTANTAYNPRLAIGVAEPGHYVVMLCEGRLKRSKGVQMAELGRLMLEEGCRVAVNMDGGQTAVMAFMGKQLNQVSTDVPKGRPSVEALAFGHYTGTASQP